MAEFENGYCTGCGFPVGRRWFRRLGGWHRPYCWRLVTMMLNVDPTPDRKGKLLNESERHQRTLAVLVRRRRHMYDHAQPHWKYAPAYEGQPPPWWHSARHSWRLIQWAQRFILTRGLWQEYQHEDTGRVCLAPIWKHPGRRWYRCRWKW